MADPVAFLVDKVLPAALSGAGGVVLSFLQLKKSFSDRLLVLEQQIPQLKQIADAAEGAVSEEKKHADEGDEKLRKADARLEKRLMSVELRLSALEAVNNKLNDDMQEFMKGQQEQWQSMNRTLGQLEGKGSSASQSYKK